MKCDAPLGGQHVLVFSMWYSRYSGTAAVQQVQQRYSNGTAAAAAVQQTRIGLLYRVLGTEGTPGTPGTAVQHGTAGTAKRQGSDLDGLAGKQPRPTRDLAAKFPFLTPFTGCFPCPRDSA